MNPRVALIAAIVAELAIGGTAHAQTGEARSMTVAYDDLNMRSAEGRKLLDRRLAAAADAVCGADDISFAPLAQRIAKADCVRFALANARGTVASKTSVIIASR